MRLKNFIHFILSLTFYIIIKNTVYTQSAQETFSELMNEDSTDVNTIAIYPQRIREAIFKVSAHPEGLVKLDVVQKKSTEAFKKRIAILSKDDQETIWNLSRYNNLIHQLARSNPNEENFKTILSNYPTDIRDEASFFALHYHSLFISLDSLKEEFDISNAVIVSEYSTDAKLAFNNLQEAPEILSLLNRNLHLTICLGDIYKTNPDYLVQQFDSLHLVIAEHQAREKEEWKLKIEKDLVAQEELKQSANEYAVEMGLSDNNYPEEEPEIKEPYDYTPYPYWCGYPWWHEPDYWYPYPFWYHTGFYLRQNIIIWIGPPSWYFIRWHFNRHHHFYNFPHITNFYINHYYFGPRRPASRHRAQVRNWINDTENLLPRDFKTDKEHRLVRIREFGKAEIDREKYNKENPHNPALSDEFLKRNKHNYPNLIPPTDRTDERKPTKKPEIKKPRKQPGELPQEKTRRTNTDPSNTLPPGKGTGREKPKTIKPEPVRPPKEITQPKSRDDRPRTIPKVTPTKPAIPKKE